MRDLCVNLPTGAFGFSTRELYIKLLGSSRAIDPIDARRRLTQIVTRSQPLCAQVDAQTTCLPKHEACC
jgi:hypothetical protein